MKTSGGFFVAVGFKQEPRAMSSCGLLAIQDPVGMANSIGRNIVCKYNIFCLFVYIWLLSLRIRNSYFCGDKDLTKIVFVAVKRDFEFLYLLIFLFSLPSFAH